MSPTWSEYLAEASEHLAAARRATEIGATLPTPPTRPEGVMPEDARDQVELLRLGYDQLAAEVASRMDVLSQAVAQSQRRSPHGEMAPARFVDTSA